MITQKKLKEALHYDPKTGIFVRNKNSGPSKKGDIAGYTRYDGYVVISLNNKKYLAHRLAWLYVFGYWPSALDHINRNPSDNRVVNLREYSQSENLLNISMWRHNSSGIKGVSWDKEKKKWEAFIAKNKKRSHLGYFNDKQKAAKARKQAERDMYGI